MRSCSYCGFAVPTGRLKFCSDICGKKYRILLDNLVNDLKKKIIIFLEEISI